MELIFSDRREDIPHNFCRLPLCCRGHMGVSVQREPRTVVPQHSGDGLDVHPVLQGYRSECVPQVVKSDLWQSCPFQDPMQHLQNTVRGDWSASQ